MQMLANAPQHRYSMEMYCSIDTASVSVSANASQQGHSIARCRSPQNAGICLRDAETLGNSNAMALVDDQKKNSGGHSLRNARP